MPAAIEYIEPNDRARDDLGGHRERADRQKDYERNLKYYGGDHPQWLIQPDGDDINDNITINVTKQALDRTLSFLFPDTPVFQIDSSQITEDEKWLNMVFRYNGGAFFLSGLGQNGALSGHNYVRIIPPKDRNSIPRLVSLNPMIPITFWRVDDPDTVLWYELFWKVGKEDMLQDVIQQDNKWTIREFRRPEGTRNWTEVGAAYEWNAPYPPIVASPHLPNPNEYYGKAEITDNSIDLNDAINRVASDIGKILRYHASPRTIAVGVTKDKIQPGAIDSLWTVEDPNVKIHNLEMQSDLASSMTFLNFLNETFLALSRVVIMKGTVKDFQRVTNTGIRAVFLDMIAKNELLRWSYGILLQRVCQSLLYVGGKNANTLPSVTWADPLPQDELETVNRLAIEQGNGWIDPESISSMRGYEFSTVKQRWNAVIKLPYIDKLLFGGSQGEGGQATRLGKTNNNEIDM